MGKFIIALIFFEDFFLCACEASHDFNRSDPFRFVMTQLRGGTPMMNVGGVVCHGHGQAHQVND